MNRFPRACATLVVVALAVLGLQAAPATAAQTPVGALRSVGPLDSAVHAQYRQYGGDGWNWASPDIVSTYPAPDGIGVVRFSSAGGPHLLVDVYDPSTRAQVGATRTVALNASFPVWGGFHAGSDGHFYALTGRDNPTEDDSRTVMIVQRFSPSWDSEGTGTIKGGATQGIKGIYQPFEAGAPAMTLVGDRLVVHTSRLLYADPDDKSKTHHQADLTFEVDTGTMTATPFGRLGDAPYASHSFNQLVTTWNGSLVLVDQGDTYPREIQMSVMSGYPTSRKVRTVNALSIPGPDFDNTTGISMTGIASGSKGVLVVGNAVRLDAKETVVDNTLARNAFVLVTDPATGASTAKKLTSFSSKGDSFAYEPRIAKIGNDRFAVVFLVGTASGISTEYRLLDSSGEVVASKSFPGVVHSSVDNPTLVGSRLFWVGTAPDTGAEGWLYGLDVSDPTAPRLAGELPSFPSSPRPSVVGTPEVGQTLTAKAGSYGVDGVSLSYQWSAEGKEIAGATSATFTPTAAQRGSTITVTVTASKTGYQPASGTSDATARVTEPGRALFPASPVPTVSGTVKVGGELTATPGSWGVEDVTFAYRWAADGTTVPGAESATFRPTAAQLGRRITVEVTASKDGYSTESRTSRSTVGVAPGTIVPGKPSVIGKAKSGVTLKAKVGTWKPGSLTYAYQWFVDGKRIGGATKSTYLLRLKRVGHRLSVRVTASRAGYATVAATSKQTAKVVR